MSKHTGFGLHGKLHDKIEEWMEKVTKFTKQTRMSIEKMMGVINGHTDSIESLRERIEKLEEKEGGNGDIQSRR